MDVLKLAPIYGIKYRVISNLKDIEALFLKKFEFLR